MYIATFLLDQHKIYGEMLRKTLSFEERLIVIISQLMGWINKNWAHCVFLVHTRSLEGFLFCKEPEYILCPSRTIIIVFWLDYG